VGGKTQILDLVFEHFPKTIHDYYEPFLGGGSVMIELLNRVNGGRMTLTGAIRVSDLNPHLIQFYTHVQSHPHDLYSRIYDLATTFDGYPTLPKPDRTLVRCKESFFYWVRSVYNSENSENGHYTLDHSAQFYFLNKTCFRGVYREGPNGFNVPYGHPKQFPVTSGDDFLCMSNLFQRVEFRVKDFREVMKELKLSNSKDFVYLDPPYIPLNKTSFVGYTEGGFDFHGELFKGIRSLKIPFLMSNANVPLLHEEFKDFNITVIKCKRHIHSKNPGSTAEEVLIYLKF
jgi:DNA adenine methylase